MSKFAPRFRPDPKPVPVIKGKKQLDKARKPTGEQPFFKTIWNTRPHRSFVSDVFLGQDARPWNFAHVLPKKKYPEFRLLDRNIVLLTQEEHQEWDQGLRADLQKDPRWSRMFELEAELKELYKKDEK